MKSIFTEDFFKNVVGFVSILAVAIVIIGVAGSTIPADENLYIADTVEAS